MSKPIPTSEDATLRHLGEEGLLARLAPLLERHTEGLPLGTGDDCAVTEAPGTDRLVWTVDSMVEGTHFRFWKNAGRPDWLGHKLAASNLSDLASKGAQPLLGLLSIGAPGDAPADVIDAFFEGLSAALDDAGARLVGGDTVRAPQWTATLALVGTLPPAATIAARHNAQPGWNVYLSGTAGESGAGLHLLERDIEAEPQTPSLKHCIERHLRPDARLALGRLLVVTLADLAMIDVSDGVARDAGRIAAASKVRVVLEESTLPISEELREAANRLGEIDGKQGASLARDLFLFGGEDFELLFATPAEPAEGEELARRASSVPVQRIGRIEAGEPGLWIEGTSGEVEAITLKGFEHFA